MAPLASTRQMSRQVSRGSAGEYQADERILWRHGNALQYSCLENPLDRGAWLATVHGVAELDMTEVT